jgi:hypothetical protein
MKPEQYDRLDARGVLSQTPQRYLETLRPPEIVGEVANPVLEGVRRFWWRAFDRVCNCIVLIRLSIHDRIYGPEPANTGRSKTRGRSRAAGQGLSSGR